VTLTSSQAAIAKSNTVALDFGWALFGRAGSVVFAVVVALSCLGALTGAPSRRSLKRSSDDSALLTNRASPYPLHCTSGSLFTSIRVVYAAARTGQLPRAFGVLDANRGTPIRAVVLQASLTIVLIFLGGGFRSLLRIAVVALWAFYFLTVRRSTFAAP
jgi:amino acid transporter